MMESFDRELIRVGRQFQWIGWAVLAIGVVVFIALTIFGVGFVNKFAGIAILALCLGTFWQIRKGDEEIDAFEAQIDNQEKRQKDWLEANGSDVSSNKR